MNWNAWSQLSGGLAKPGSPVTVVGRDVLFFTNSDGGVVTTVLGSGRWASVSEGSSTPGAPVTAMPWGPNRIALFVADRSGGGVAVNTTHDIINRLPELPLEPFQVAGTCGQVFCG